MTLPAWITPEFFTRVETMVYDANDYIFGAAGFGRKEEVELIRLKAGVLLKEMLQNMEDALNGATEPLYRIYSAHDTTVQAFLMTLEAKEAIIGKVLPDFAATAVVELWKDQSNFAYVKLWYSDNAQTELRDVTSTIGGCGGGYTCTYQDFAARSAKFVEVDFDKACLKL
uniref:acid phosphatase n=1 Tax=Panagrellus redivivus TaxID=6233 RepID=A0A7E4ZX65_PANRE